MQCKQNSLDKVDECVLTSVMNGTGVGLDYEGVSPCVHMVNTLNYTAVRMFLLEILILLKASSFWSSVRKRLSGCTGTNY